MKKKSMLENFSEWLDSQNGFDFQEEDKEGLLNIFSRFFREKEIEELGFKILMIENQSNYSKKYNDETGKFHSIDNEDESGMFLTSALSKGWVITKVQRLEDGEVFSIQDKVVFDGDVSRIMKFEFVDTNLNVQAFSFESPLHSLEKPREICRTFFDEVVIYGDRYFYLTYNQANLKLEGPYECTFADSSVSFPYIFNDVATCTEFKILKNYMGEHFDEEEFKKRYFPIIM